MAETAEAESRMPDKPAASFTIWPPTDRTRDAVSKRLVETLSAPSVLSKRYGTIPHDDALATARRIEEEAFAAATASASTDDDGIEILQLYSKEISKRMLEAVKSRSAPEITASQEEPAGDTSGEITQLDTDLNNAKLSS
jgi:hypothetical protein